MDLWSISYLSINQAKFEDLLKNLGMNFSIKKKKVFKKWNEIILVIEILLKGLFFMEEILQFYWLVFKYIAFL